MKHLLSLTAVALLAWSTQAQTTFNVDMACAPEFDNVFVTGPWCGWCANDVYNTMTDPDGDGIYTVTLDTTVTGLIEYKYAINGFEGQENLVNDMLNGASCAPITDFNAYANRTIEEGSVATDTYGTCDGICNDEAPTMVTFRVDMSEYTGSANASDVTWNSETNGWCGACAPMNDEGNGIFELTVPLTGDTVEYKFSIGNWVDQEDLAEGAACALTTYDEGAPNGCCYVNRFVVLTGETAIDMPVVCWGSCEACGFVPTPGCTDEEACNYSADATEDDESCEYDSCAGCTDALACNYDEAALIDNGSCEYGAQLTFGFNVLDALCHDGQGSFALDSATVALGDTTGITFSIDTLALGADTLTLAPGYYTLIGTDAEGCSSDTTFVIAAPDTLEVSVTVVMEATPDMADGQAEATVTGGTPGYELLWNNMTGMSVDPDSLAGGLYTVVATDSLGCSATASFTMTVSEVDGLGEVDVLEGALFPVPVGDELNVRLATPLNGDAQVDVRDAQGRLIARTQMRKFDQNLTLDATSWNSGIYTLQLITKEAIASWKFVK
ncbi:MAG: T9SS type A sorting domain-containing protein [Bacteroidota bacterium]|nr:T9SS type A sorting domain-containing protein [Bacteroidota bacterium]